MNSPQTHSVKHYHSTAGHLNADTRHETASCRRTGKIKGRATSTTAVNPISTQPTLQPHALKIQAKSKQMYFSFCRPFISQSPLTNRTVGTSRAIRLTQHCTFRFSAHMYLTPFVWSTILFEGTYP